MSAEEQKESFQLLVDADSCPERIRNIVLKACVKNSLGALFVADRKILDVEKAANAHTALLRKAFLESGGRPEDKKSIRSPIRMKIVPTGLDSADNFLVHVCKAGDLCVTRDFRLAFRLIEKGALVITDRGKTLDSSNIRKRLSEKETNLAFRAGLFEAEQNSPLASRDLRAFASAFQKALALCKSR